MSYRISFFNNQFPTKEKSFEDDLLLDSYREVFTLDFATETEAMSIYHELESTLEYGYSIALFYRQSGSEKFLNLSQRELFIENEDEYLELILEDWELKKGTKEKDSEMIVTTPFGDTELEHVEIWEELGISHLKFKSFLKVLRELGICEIDENVLTFDYLRIKRFLKKDAPGNVAVKNQTDTSI